MEETERFHPQSVSLLHVSIGSATTGAHFSFDLPLSEIHGSQLTSLVDFLVDYSQRVEIARSQFKARLKG